MIYKAVPLFRPMPWGNLSLNEFFKVDSSSPIGEIWLLSDYPSMKTKLVDENGTVHDASILLEIFGLQLLRFPLLLKLISSSEWLSVQVHPDDELAQKLENEPWGKTECWFFLQDSLIALLDQQADGEVCFARNNWNECLTFLKPKKNDFVYIPAGLIHALGPGSTLIEIQQSSDLTYRIYDWGRTRETHLLKARLSMKKYDINQLHVNDFCSHSSEYFEIHRANGKTHILSNAIVISLEESFLNNRNLNKYETLVVTAESVTRLDGNFLVIKPGRKWYSGNNQAAG